MCSRRDRGPRELVLTEMSEDEARVLGSAHRLLSIRVERSPDNALLSGGGCPNCLRFFGTSHLLSGGEDGELCIWRTSDWECLVRMKGHKGAVLDFAIHTSGRIALSVASDAKLMLWNLLTGKHSYEPP